jgi:hypothetical protein
MTTTNADLSRTLARLRNSELSFKARLAERIDTLVVAFEEDYEGHQPSARSIDGLIDFLAASPPSQYPDLTFTPAGDCYAEWRSLRGKVAIEFLASGDARYLVFRPNPRHPQRTDRLTGTTTTDALSETMAPLALLAGLAA